MSGGAYYNEHDKYCAQWLRNLIDAGHIAPGVVDERNIEDVKPKEIAGYTQCHFFAGLGGWSYALRLAGWPDDKPIWTGSCPCQPFSKGGTKRGLTDERHLWPFWHWLITQVQPRTIFGEQTSSELARAWLDLVSTDLEEINYTVRSNVMGSSSVGAPNIRERIWFIARTRQHTVQENPLDRMANSNKRRCEDVPRIHQKEKSARTWSSIRRRSNAGKLAKNSTQSGQEKFPRIQRPGPVNGFWKDADWLYCTDGKWRSVEPGAHPLATRVSNAMGRMRAYGNAINPYIAAEIIKAYKGLDIED